MRAVSDWVNPAKGREILDRVTVSPLIRYFLRSKKQCLSGKLQIQSCQIGDVSVSGFMTRQSCHLGGSDYSARCLAKCLSSIPLAR